LYGVTLRKGYRQWQLIAPTIEAEPLNELLVVLGNAKAIQAYACHQALVKNHDYVFTRLAR